MKKVVILLFVLIVVSLGVYFFVSKDKINTKEEIPIGASESTDIEQEDKTESMNPVRNSSRGIISNGVKNENHPNSILNLINKQFDGSGFEVGNILSQNSAYTRYFITYKSDGLKISGIMNMPAGIGPFPVLILNHGHIDPSVYTNGRGLMREQDYFARSGYVVIHPDYRGHAQSDPDPESGDEQGLAYSGYANDAINAILAAKNSGLPYLDAERVGMLGHSMGGGVTMNALIARPDLVDAAVLFAPVSSDYQKNFFRWRKDGLNPEEISEIESEIGDVNDKNNFLAFSSATYFNRISTPIMIHQGTADKDVPVEWSRETRDKLALEGKGVAYFEYSGEPHEFAAAWPLVMRRSLDFFNKNLK